MKHVLSIYSISTTVLQRWLKNPSIKKTRDKLPSKIPNDVFLKDVVQYPGDCIYERAQRLGYRKSGIEIVLKRLSISQKKDLSVSKSMSDQKSGVFK